ncbi:MAG TPA: hypothetical protein VLH37_08130 [Bacteroidales bacterium]|nr:hypothetical protein [Bacteroidales bacterium]
MKKDFILTLTMLLLLLGATSCQAKARSTSLAADVLVEEAQASDVAGVVEAPQAARNQPRFGLDSLECLKNMSMYNENFRQRNFAMAIEPWRWMFFNCPLASENLYIHGVTLVRYMIDRETVPQRREALIDTLMMVYQQRIKYFGREGANLGRQVLELKFFRPNATREHYELSERSIVLQGNASIAEVLRVNFFAAKILVESGLLDASKLVDKYDRASEIIAHNITNNHRDAAAFASAKDQIQTMFDPFATCENLIRIYTPRIAANPQDPELLRRVTAILDRAGCTDSQLFYTATKNLHQLSPTAQSAFLMGRLYSNQNNFPRALAFYEQAVALSVSAPANGIDLFQTHMQIADILFRQLNRLPQARTAALAAAEIRPQDGRPHLLIGQMYAISAKTCGTDEISIAAGYWAAVDRFIRARTIDTDPQIVETANQLISSISQHFPNNETLFFHGLDGGRQVRAGCWINEVTFARPRP